MFARLAFSVAINVDPDILIVDEVLSVGDARFQSKSIKKMESIRNKGTTILFVSHSIGQIKRFCNKAIWIDQGTLKLIGEQTFVSDKYEDNLYLKETTKEETKEIKSIQHNRDFKIIAYTLNKENIKTFEDIELKIDYEVYQDKIEDLLVGVAIFDNEKNYIFGPNTYLDKIIIKNTKGQHSITYILPNIPLLSGTYFMHIGFFTDKGIVNLEFISDAVSFTIENKYFTEGRVYLEHKWR
jgi:teichoic acid transport system ATP-binding protein